MDQSIIDLSSYQEGVTLDVEFDFSGSAAPFLVFITNLSGERLFYYRLINKNKVQINLPEHPDQVILFSQLEAPIKNVLIGPIRINRIIYKPNYEIITPRNYAFEDIEERVVPVILEPRNFYGSDMMVPTEQPARFHPGIGIAEFSAYAMDKMPQPAAAFVREHEKGHYYYGRPLPPMPEWKNFSEADRNEIIRQFQEDEEEADRFSLYQLINKGYTFSNLFSSLSDHLSDNYINQARIKRLYDVINMEHKNLLNDWT